MPRAFFYKNNTKAIMLLSVRNYGLYKKQVNLIDVEGWGKVAEAMLKLKKGDTVMVQGSVDIRHSIGPRKKKIYYKNLRCVTLWALIGQDAAEVANNQAEDEEREAKYDEYQYGDNIEDYYGDDVDENPESCPSSKCTD
mgnify:CR=1 FL=1